MRACHNVHTPMHGSWCRPFISFTSAQALISSIGMLPSGCDMLYCMLNSFFRLALTSQCTQYVFHSCKKIANSVLRDKQGLHRSDQDIFYLRNIIWLHGTGIIVTALTRVRKLESSLHRFLRKSRYNNMEYRFLRPMFTKSENKDENCK
jgi:hypothetical protein